MISSYKELIVWQKSIELCSLIYEMTKQFPKNEVYGLTSQIRRSAVAIPSNIAEGNMRGHRLEYMQFLRIAFGSAGELETQLLISVKIGYINQTQYDQIIKPLGEILKMLNKLINVL